MKKKIMLIASIAALTVVSFSGCGSKGNVSATEATTEDSTGIAVADYDATDYVTLGEYKNLEVKYEGSFNVTDDDVATEIKSVIDKNTTSEEITDRKDVQNGDIANIDYAGKVDGEAFDGGTGTSYDLTIGSKTFIDGFEDQLIGKNVGDTFDIKVTFPENYSKTDLAGKEAVFTVTVNKISKSVVPELNDDFVAKVSDSKTVDEYKAALKVSLQDKKDAEVESYKTYYAYSQAVQNSTVDKYPEGLLESNIEQYKSSVKKEAESASVEYADYLSTYYGMKEDDFNTQLEQYMKEVVKEQLVFEAICKVENLDLTDDEFDQKCEEYASQNGFDSADAVKSNYDEKDLKKYFQMMKVYDFIGKSATIVEADSTAEAATQASSEAK